MLRNSAYSSLVTFLLSIQYDWLFSQLQKIQCVHHVIYEQKDTSEQASALSTKKQLYSQVESTQL